MIEQTDVAKFLISTFLVGAIYSFGKEKIENKKNSTKHSTPQSNFVNMFSNFGKKESRLV